MDTKVRNPQVPAMAGTCLGIRFPPRPGWAEQRRRGRIKILDVRRPRSGLVSKISGHFEQRRLPEAQRRDPDSGSPFFSLGFFGEAKKSKSPAGARPGMPARLTYYQLNSCLRPSNKRYSPNSLKFLSGASAAKCAGRFSFMAVTASRTCWLLQIAPCSQPICCRASSTEWSRA